MPRGRRNVRPSPTYVFNFWAFDKETKSFGEPFEFQLDKGMDCKTFEELFHIMADRTRSVQHNEDHKKLLQINPQEFILYFDGCNLEWSATPRGIALTEEDAIAAFPKSVFKDVKTILGDNFYECASSISEGEKLAQNLADFISGIPMINETSRKGFIEFGLNPVLKEPIFIIPHMKQFHKGPHKEECDVEKCQEGVKEYIENSNLQVVSDTVQSLFLDYRDFKPKPPSVDFGQFIKRLKNLNINCMDTFVSYIYTHLRDYQVEAISSRETKRKKLGENQLLLANYVYDFLERYCELNLIKPKLPITIFQPLIEYFYKSNIEKSNYELLLENFSFDKSIYGFLCEEAYIFSYFAAKDLDFHDMLNTYEDYDELVIERNKYLVRKSYSADFNDKRVIEDYKMRLGEKFQHCDVYEKSLLYAVLFPDTETDDKKQDMKDLGRILLRPKDRLFVIGPPRNDVGINWGENVCPSLYTRGGNNYTNMNHMLETYTDHTKIKIENLLEVDESLLGEFCEITCTTHPKTRCKLDGESCEAHSHTTACLDPFFKFQCVIGHSPKYHIALRKKEVPVVDEIDSIVSELEKTENSTNTKKKKSKKKKKGKKEAAAETKSTNQTTEDLDDLSNITNESTCDILNVESQAANDDDELAARFNQELRSLEAEAPELETEAEKEKNNSPDLELGNGLLVFGNSIVINSLDVIKFSNVINIPVRCVAAFNLRSFQKAATKVVDPSRDWIILVHTLDNDVLSIARKNVPDINKSVEAKLLAKEFCSTIVQILEQSPHYRVLISILLPKFYLETKADEEVFCNFNNILIIMNESIHYILQNHPRVEYINHNSWLEDIDNEGAKAKYFKPDGRYLTQEGLKKASDKWIKYLNKIFIETPPREMNTVDEAVDHTVHPAQAEDDVALFVLGDSEFMRDILDAVELKNMLKIPVYPILIPAMNVESLGTLTTQVLQPSQKALALLQTLQCDVFKIASRSECSAENKHEMTKELALGFCDFIDKLLSKCPQLEIIISDRLPGSCVILWRYENEETSVKVTYDYNTCLEIFKDCLIEHLSQNSRVVRIHIDSANDLSDSNKRLETLESNYFCLKPDTQRIVDIWLEYLFKLNTDSLACQLDEYTDYKNPLDYVASDHVPLASDNEEEFVSDDAVSQQPEQSAELEILEEKKKEPTKKESKKKGSKGQSQSKRNSKKGGKKVKETNTTANPTTEVKSDVAHTVDNQPNNANTNENLEYVGGAKRKTTKAKPLAVAETGQFVTKYSGLSMYEIEMLENRHTKELEVLNNELAELDNGAQQFINEMHYKLSTTQTRIDKLEDKTHANVKQVAALDDQINELVKKLNKLKSEKQSLVAENVEFKREMDELTEERRNLEKVFEMDIGEKNKNKESKMSEISKIEENLSLLLEEKEARESGKAFMKEQIKTKESDLECPVCMEVSQVPIYTCQEQHIICSECWYKVKMKSVNKIAECVLCRLPYPDPPRHHRYMEKTAQELNQLYAVYSNLINGVQ